MIPNSEPNAIRLRTRHDVTLAARALEHRAADLQRAPVPPTFDAELVAVELAHAEEMAAQPDADEFQEVWKAKRDGWVRIAAVLQRAPEPTLRKSVEFVRVPVAPVPQVSDEDVAAIQASLVELTPQKVSNGFIRAVLRLAASRSSGAAPLREEAT